MMEEQLTNLDDPGWEEEWKNWSGQDLFIQAIEEGRKGNSFGMPNGLGKVNDYLFGTQKGRYYLIGADSGVGKSTLADEMIFTLWSYCRSKKIELAVNYWSMEMSEMEKKAQYTGRMVARLFGSKGVSFPPDYILGKIQGHSLTDVDRKYIHSAYSIVKDFFGSIRFHEYTVNPTGMLMDLIRTFYSPEHGQIIRQPLTEEQKKEGRKEGRIIGWIPRNPKRIVVQVIDHVALAEMEKGLHGYKDVIDKQSMYAVQSRNLFGTITFAIQQFNSELTSTFRMNRRNESMLHPQRLDFGDSKYTFRDADAVFGLLRPKDFDLQKFHKYDVSALGSYLTFLFLMKNRYGVSGRMFPKFMNPYSGVFHDLPPDPLNPLIMEPWYRESKRLDAICQQYKPVKSEFSPKNL